MKGCDAGEGDYRIIDQYNKNKYLKNSIYDAVSRARYTPSTTYGTFKYVKCSWLDEIVKINEKDTLEN